jgi:site-specific DNA-cytosine methylase
MLEKYILSDSKLTQIANWKSFQNPLSRVRGLNSLSPTITTRVAESYGGGINASTVLLSTKLDDDTDLKEKVESGCVFTDLNIRKLTPRECGRLMGVSEPDIDKMEKCKINDDKDLYNQFGNSIVVDMLYYALKPLFKEGEN